ncbi:MAG: HAMP domain-containing histidine kinase [Acidobacteria bacterium]|nr:HAMP domain-containing histidine kinase [Acidobacteriota bacterium]
MTRVWQVVILILLAISAVQVSWWMVDQTRRSEALRQRITQLYSEDARAAIELHRRGVDAVAIERIFPHLEMNSSGELVVSRKALEDLRQQRVRWLSQYGWEGGFFLAVLVISMAAVWRALYQESVLRRRQQNFIAAVSHELKSPLASLQLSAETLSFRDLPRDQILKLAHRLRADAGRMEDMISKILDTSQLDQGWIVLHPEPLEIGAMVDHVLEELEHRITEVGARVHVDIAPDLAIRADPVGVRTVLSNLLDNALKAVRGKDQGTLRIRAVRDKRYVHLRVEDDGVGFRPEESVLLFEKFYRPGNEMRREGSGQGLGLYIARRFVELEKGRLKAHSDGINQGAVFEVSWPAVRDQA